MTNGGELGTFDWTKFITFLLERVCDWGEHLNTILPRRLERNKLLDTTNIYDKSTTEFRDKIL